MMDGRVAAIREALDSEVGCSCALLVCTQEAPAASCSACTVHRYVMHCVAAGFTSRRGFRDFPGGRAPCVP